MRRVLIGLVSTACMACPPAAPSRAAEQAPAGAAPPGPAQSTANEPAKDQAPRLDNRQGIHQMITEIVRSNIPMEYEDTRKWGGTKEVFDGLKISRDGLRIKTKRRKKQVKHGTWKKYHVRLVDPEREFHVRLERAGPSGDGRLEFDIVFVARLAVFGRLSQWQTGVQLISLSADAEAKVNLRVTCRLALRLDSGKFPPDMILDPEVTDADLELVEFRLRRISNARGPLVKQLGRELREVLERKLVEKRAKLVNNMNRQIDKKRDELRLSL